ncbi:hypothetical protein FN846DRAFT_651380 [Sphaerosporella brunnea]|uniref:FAD-binding domain-containing protein n=1 Tax=Sphaerosporella brunnea TaxID=1250544 RepID=A0A5J5F084_9PEZI|nr:hypothetical protein FN846DRAFT_651380 [Sphaerosporella brunnea]
MPPSPTPRKKHILIIGAGIAGLCFALQILTHAHDYYTISVFEKTPGPDANAGFCIILPPNAVRILRELGLDLVAEDCATPLTHTRLHSASGETLLEARGLFPRDPTSLLTVERGKFVALLLRQLQRRGALVNWDRKVIGVLSAPDGVEVRFRDAPSVTADLCVGADGTWSGVRKALYSGRPAWLPKPTRWTALYGISPVEESATEMLRLYLRRGAPGAYATYSLSRGRVFWICYESSTPSSPLGDPEETLREFEYLPYGPAGFGHVINRAETTPRKVRLWHTVFATTADVHGVVVLIGDAAHPQTTFVGQGAARGIEEGAELRRHLLRAAWAPEHSLRAAVTAFAQASAPRSRRVAGAGWWAGAAVMGDWAWSRWARDAAVRWIVRAERKRQQQQQQQQVHARIRAAKGNPSRKQRQNKREHWLLDYRVLVETEEEFCRARAAQQQRRRRGRRWMCAALACAALLLAAAMASCSGQIDG